jgi:hypothetical protein
MSDRSDFDVPATYKFIEAYEPAYLGAHDILSCLLHARSVRRRVCDDVELLESLAICSMSTRLYFGVVIVPDAKIDPLATPDNIFFFIEITGSTSPLDQVLKGQPPSLEGALQGT